LNYERLVNVAHVASIERAKSVPTRSKRIAALTATLRGRGERRTSDGKGKSTFVSGNLPKG